MDEFMFGLDRLDIPLNPMNVELLFFRYDSDRDGKLGFLEFSNMLLPLEIRLRDQLENK
jgi:hypothetical protein